MANLHQLLKAMIEKGASDVHITTNSPPQLRIDGKLQQLKMPPLSPSETKQICYSILTDAQKHKFEENNELDLSFGVRGLSRFRANIFMQRGAVAGAFRAIPYKVISIEELGLPKAVVDITKKPRGLVLVTGPTGSGKSTTLASIIDRINEERHDHIVTIEDPIEYLFTDKVATINQREIGIDVLDFKIALRALVRENPDIVLIGEMRDAETFEAALMAAETGHLVYGTIHASSTTQTFSRIYGLFEQDEVEGIRKILAYQMRAFVYQKLLPTLHENIHRIPAIEILINDAVVQKFILEGREGELREYLNSIEARQRGMVDFNQSLVDLVEKEYIHMRVAIDASPNVDELMMRLKKLG